MPDINDAPTLHTAAMPPQGPVSSTVSSQASVAPNPLRRIAAALKKDDGDVILTKVDDNLFRLDIRSESSNAAFRHIYDARGVFEERRSFAPSSTYTTQDVAEEEDSAAFYRQGEDAHQYYFNQSGLESAVTQLGTTDDMSTEETTALVNGLRADLEVGQSSTSTPESQEQDNEQANDSGNETDDNSDGENANQHQAKPEIDVPKKPTKEALEKL